MGLQQFKEKNEQRKRIQIIGAVIDVEFEKDNIPNVYEALTIDGLEIILEVQQQLGDGIVRTIAMGTTEGLKRGLQAERTNAPISVPVGTETLGRIMDVLVTQLMKRAQLVSRKECQFTESHLLMLISLAPMSF